MLFESSVSPHGKESSKPYSDLLAELAGAGVEVLSVFAADPLSVEPLSVPPEAFDAPSELELPAPESADLAEGLA
jgi:hypothetical protein